MTFTTYRVRLSAICLGIVAACFLQAPGRIVADTKLDLVTDPAAFLGRSLHLWEPLGYFGQLQNQAYGYLFPMGPFFLVGHLLHLDPWVVQRLWWSLLMCVAMLGVIRLARLLDMGTPNSRVVAGLAYAVAPRMLSELGSISSETLPFVLLPWVLVPLVRFERGELGHGRAVARSGLAVVAMGGINGAATLMVLPLPLLYVLTRAAITRRALLWRWLLAVVAATAWWLAPLLLLGRYGYPFLGYIETAAQTTANTSLVEVLRGTSQWLGYLVLSGRPVWPAAWTLVSSGALILQTALLAGLGLAGIAHRRCPQRRFLVAGAVLGLLLLSSGHLGADTGPQAASLHSLLDGALAPFRNVHKFDAVLRLPLVLGLAHLGGVLPSRVTVPSLRRLAYVAVPLLVLGTAAPLLTGNIPARGTYVALPQPWRQASVWLDQHASEGRALIVPAASDGAYLWGQPRDEPLVALSRVPWAVRDAVPLGSAGTTRLMDAWTSVLDSGAGSPGLAASLARTGVRFLVVRNDLDLTTSGAPVPERIQTALALSPGIRLVASFGVRGADGRSPGSAGDAPFGLGTLADRFPAVQVYEVEGSGGGATAEPLSALHAVSGGPEALIELAAAGQLPSGPIVLDGDLTPRAAADLANDGLTSVPRIVTDTLRHRLVDFGVVRDNAGPTLPADLRPAAGALPWDVLPFAAQDFQTDEVLGGVAELVASTTAAAGGEPGLFDPAAGPSAAFDGDPTTAWTSGSTGRAVGEYLQVRLSAPRQVSRVSFDVRSDAVLQAKVRAVRVATDAGSVVVPVPATGGRVVATLPAGNTTVVTLTVTAADVLGPDPRVRLDAVDLGGIDLTRSLHVATAIPPGTQAGAPATVVLARALGARSACVLQAGAWLCVPGLARGVEDGITWRREVGLASSATYLLDGSLVARPGAGLDALLRTGRLVTLDASTSLTADPAMRGDAAVDADPSTTWVSGTADAIPRLTLRWIGVRRVDRLTPSTNPALQVAHPTRVEVTGADGSTVVAVGADGTVAFPATTTDHLVLRIVGRSAGTTVLPSFDEVPTPVGITDIAVPGVTPTASLLARVVPVPCGQGPIVDVGGTFVSTQAAPTEGALVTGRPVPFTACGSPVSVPAGAMPVVATSTPALTVDSVVLRQPGTSPVPAARRSVATLSWSSSSRRLQVGAGPAAVLSIAENANAGWVATLDGVALPSLRLEGWRQGYLLPAGHGGTVVLSFTPQQPFRSSLALGALAVLALVVVGVRRGRRAPGAAVTTAPERSGGRWAYVTVAVALLLLGGVGGVVAGGAAALVAARRPGRAPWLAAAGVLAAGALVATKHWYGGVPPALSAPAQLLCLAAVGALLGSLLLPGLPESLERTLDEGPAGGGEGAAEQHGEGQDGPEATGERVSVQQP